MASNELEILTNNNFHTVTHPQFGGELLDEVLVVLALRLRVVLQAVLVQLGYQAGIREHRRVPFADQVHDPLPGLIRLGEIVRRR